MGQIGVLEGGTVKEFHCDEGAAVLFADVVNGADIGMVESRGGFGFATEAPEGLAVGRELFGKEFEGDEAVQTRVLRYVHHTHAATAEAFENAVVGDCCADEVAGSAMLRPSQAAGTKQVNESRRF